ncbi:MAG: Zn-ribbon domain-containing protein [Methanosarcinales archaeon Met12]|nr:MAG: Zn-ribbon domain-containing protein [Methanosarcinales archaeon Met12]
MPHKCTRCGQTFRDGASEILSGCPTCGWNKFLYVTDRSEEIARQDVLSEDAEVMDINELINKVEIEEKPKTHPAPDSHRVESIKILCPGSYELNIKSLLDRPEIIMALKEEGTYMVHLPSIFSKGDKKRKSGRKRRK